MADGHGTSGIFSSDGSVKVIGGGTNVDLSVVTSGGGITLGGDLSGSNTSQEVIGITSIPVVGGATTGQVLVVSAGSWTPTSIPLGISAGTGIGVAAAAGIYTISNTGVLSVAATAGSGVTIGGSGTAPTVGLSTMDVLFADNAPVAAVAMNAQRITGLANGSGAQDAAAYGQIASALSAYLPLTGGTLSGAVAMGSHKITGLTNGTASSDAAAFGQIPTALSQLTGNIANTVGNSDGTLTISPTSGAVTASLALGHANTWTAIQTMPLLNEANQAVTVTSNAGTCSAAFGLNTFTNSSAATMAITIATAGAVDGQLMIVRIYDASAVAETIGWTNTENSTISVPLTSNGSTTLPLTVGFQYNSQTSKWRCIALA